MLSIHDLPVQEKPREKLIRQGANHLTDVELMAIILGKGTRHQDVLTLSHQVLHHLQSRTTTPSLRELTGMPEVGNHKACQILASLELSQRFVQKECGTPIVTPQDAVPVLAWLKQAKQEKCVVLTLDGANQLIRSHVITQGLVNQSQTHPRETFYPAIEDRAVSILLAHNHPSGNLRPSQADLQCTAKLVEVSRVIGIPILDHLIITPKGYTSIRREASYLFETHEK